MEKERETSWGLEVGRGAAAGGQEQKNQPADHSKEQLAQRLITTSIDLTRWENVTDDVT